MLEEKLAVRKELLSAREIVSEKLNEIDQYERRQEDNEAVMSDLKHDLMAEQEQVSRKLMTDFGHGGL